MKIRSACFCLAALALGAVPPAAAVSKVAAPVPEYGYADFDWFRVE